MYQFTEEELHKWYVKENKSLRKIGEIINCCNLTVRRLLVKHNIPIKKKNGRFQDAFYVDHNFFKEWSSDMAYLLGYITSDGCIRPNKYELKFKSIDFEILEHVQKLLKTNYSIKNYKDSNCYVLCVFSKQIIDDLLFFGITPNKSYTIPFMKVPDEFFWDYLRGEVDGDGCIYPPKIGSKQIGMNIVGNEIFLKGLKSHLKDKINCKDYALNYNCADKRICTLPIYGESAYLIMKNLYANDNYGLSRKKQLAIKVLQHYDSLKTKYCEACGVEFVNTTNRRHFCVSCSEKRGKHYRKIYYKTYRKSKQQIIHGDCLQVMKDMFEETVDVCVCSPVYNIGIKYNSYKDTIPIEQYLDWTTEWASEVKRILKVNGSFFINIGNTSSDPYISERVCNILSDLFYLQNNIVWVKSISIAEQTYGHFKPINSQRYLNNCWEKIFHFTKTGDVVLDRLAVGVPYADKSNINRWKNKKIDCRCAGNCWFIPYKTVVAKKDHPAGFPIELPIRCIKLHGIKENMLVVDPFLGAGTTLQACKELGVSGIGIDLDEEYCKIADQRLNL